MTPILRRVAFLVFLLAAVGAMAAERGNPPAAEKPAGDKPAAGPAKKRVLVTISKETTYITEPLRPDGYPDYIAALNKRASQGVTPENNAAVLLWKAVGPRMLGPDEREKFFAMLGITLLPDQGDYFIPLETYAKEHGRGESPADAKGEQEGLTFEEIWARYDAAVKRPWSKKDFPALAGWLTANEKPLKLIVEATKRPRRYDPLLWTETEMVIAVLLPGVQQHRDAARALRLRAMLRAGQGEIHEAWEDLLSVHRLARLAGQGPFLVDGLVALAIEGVAEAGDQALLQDANLSAGQVAKIRADLAGLAPPTKMADCVDVSERFSLLDAVCLIARDGISSLTSMPIDKSPKSSFTSLMESLGSAAIDWDLILRLVNSWYERMAAAIRLPTRTERHAALSKINEDIAKQAKAAKDWKSLPPVHAAQPPKGRFRANRPDLRDLYAASRLGSRGCRGPRRNAVRIDQAGLCPGGLPCRQWLVSRQTGRSGAEVRGRSPEGYLCRRCRFALRTAGRRLPALQRRPQRQGRRRQELR
jgi:hypothetical protein